MKLPYEKFNEEFEAFYPKLITKLPHPSTARNVAFKDNIKDTLLKSFEHKAKLAEAIELPPDLRFKFNTDNPSLIKSHASFKEFEKGIKLLDDFPAEDETGRDLYKMVTENMVRLEGRSMRFSKLIIPQLIVRNSAVNWQQHFATLGEVIAQQKKAAYITANPLDIMFSTEESGYTSCYRLAGPHGMGNLSYCYDNFTTMTYMMGNNNQKIARAFAYFNPANYKEFILGKVYGQEPIPTAKLITAALLEKLGHPKGILEIADPQRSPLEMPMDCLKGISSHWNPAHHAFGGFFDKLITARFSENKCYWTMNFTNAVCLTCSNLMTKNSEQYHQCDDCQAKYKPCRCASCGFQSMNLNEFKTLEGASAYANKLCMTCYQVRFGACVKCHTEARKDSFYEGHCRTCTHELFVLDFRNKRILRTEAKQFYNISSRQVFAKALKSGKPPAGLFATVAEATKAKAKVIEKKKELLQNSQDRLGKFQFEFEQAVTTRFPAIEETQPYILATQELLALD